MLDLNSDLEEKKEEVINNMEYILSFDDNVIKCTSTHAFEDFVASNYRRFDEILVTKHDGEEVSKEESIEMVRQALEAASGCAASDYKVVKPGTPFKIAQ